jgi:hypothetical protein
MILSIFLDIGFHHPTPGWAKPGVAFTAPHSAARHNLGLQ